MDYEQKYKDVLEKLRDFYRDYDTVSHLINVKEELANLFPELKESEDERIRKALIRFHKSTIDIDGIKGDDILAWLEKQGEQKETLCDKCKKAQPSHSCQDITALGRCYIENINTSINKVEPKFNVGDWVVLSTSYGEKVVQIDSIEHFKSGEPMYITSEGRWFGNGTKARLLTDKDVETITLPESKIIVKQKPTWSEEDKLVVEDIEEAVINYWHGQSQEDLLDWLKSLKERCTWKPTEEQMKALHDLNLTGGISYAGQGQELINLYNDLNKLKE